MQMFTDPARVRPDISADPDAPHNVVFRYHEVFNDDRAEVEELKARYRQGKVGDVEVKRRLIAALERFLTPIRERRAYYAARPHIVDEILTAGAEKVRPISQATLAEAIAAMGLSARRLEELKAHLP
jgi:tryptophanyl-tRNA synthetase